MKRKSYLIYQTILVTLLSQQPHCLCQATANSTSAEQSTTTTTQINAVPSARCQDRLGSLPVDRFELRQCTMCYVHLFRSKPLELVRPHYDRLLLIINGAISEVIVPDRQNETTVRRICATLTADECADWLACCDDAHACCVRQQTTPRFAPTLNGTTTTAQCRRTWDGFSCFDDTPAGTDVVIRCPRFLQRALSSRTATKTCTQNGTWFTKDFKEWTNYNSCYDKQLPFAGVYAGLISNAVSFIVLIPAICIFSLYRDLRTQHRIRIHINFFASLAISCCANFAWYRVVHYDLLVNPSPAAVLHRNPVWCRVLSYVKIYSTSSSYCWMFCEGFYLHRLISKTFEAPKSLAFVYLFGWAMPVTTSTVYAIVRYFVDNEQCWAVNVGRAQWIIYALNLSCLAMNCLFLCNIVRILVFKLHSHPNEPSNFRRGVRAAFMLIPLFGLHLFFMLHRLEFGQLRATEQLYYVHEMVFMLTVGSQGTVVALVFCFFNGEVLTRIRSSIHCLMTSRHPNGIGRDRCVSIQMTIGEVRQSLSGSLMCRPPATTWYRSPTGCRGRLLPTFDDATSRELKQTTSACSSLSNDEEQSPCSPEVKKP